MSALTCERQHKPSGLPYLAWHLDADARHKAGERQIQCPDCNKWFWPHEFGREARSVTR